MDITKLAKYWTLLGLEGGHVEVYFPILFTSERLELFQNKQEYLYSCAFLLETLRILDGLVFPSGGDWKRCS